MYGNKTMFDITYNANKSYCMVIDNKPQDNKNIHPVAIRLLNKCMSMHLNTNANVSLESNANANANAIFQECIQMQMQMSWGHIQMQMFWLHICKCI